MDSKTTRLVLGLGLLGVVGFVIYKMSATAAPKPVIAAGGSQNSSGSTASEITAAGGALSSIFAQLTPDTSDSSTG